MRLFFVVLATTSFLSGACGGQAASCTYSNLCEATQVAGPPTYLKDCVFACNVKMVSKVELFNDNYGPLTSVKFAMREQCFNDRYPQVAVYDSTLLTSTFPCSFNSSCTTVDHECVITAQSAGITCCCHTGDRYQTVFWVGYHWDATYGYTFNPKTSAFTTAP